MAYRFKARSATPGEYNFSAGTLGFAPAVSAVLTSAHIGDGTSGTYQPVAAADVQAGVAVGVSPAVGTFAVPAESIVKSGETYGDSAEFTGTYDPMAAAVFPAEANVSNVETAYGPTGAEYAGSLDVDALEAAAYSSGYDAGAIDGAATQYATDAAAVDAVKAGIRTTVTVLGVTGTLDLSLYCLIAGITWPALDEVDGGVAFGPVTGTEYEGTGVNATTLENMLDAKLADIPADIKTAMEAEGSHLALILEDTGTSGVAVAEESKTGYALTSAERISIADAILTRDIKAITTSVTYCLYTLIMAPLKSLVTGASWVIQKPSGAEHKTGTVTTDVNGNITGADLGDES